MRFVSFVSGGKPTWGLVSGDGVIDLGARGPHAVLKDAIAAGDIMEIGAAAHGEVPDVALSDIAFLPTIPDPTHIFCAGKNYKDHVTEMGFEMPDNLSLFLKANSTLVPHGGAMIRPKVSECLDFEGEICAVIGREARHVSEDNALDYVAGYTIMVDGSVRDIQKHSVTAGKNFVGTGPLGPVLKTADEIPDPSQLHVTTRLNGEVVQDCGADMLIFDIPYIIAYVSRITTLLPGDVIATGSPAGSGAGRTPLLWMKAGDRLEVEVPKIGNLTVDIVDE
ncbi:MAG: 5-carboxymethyl-2-hydroxymuconate isomerase [Rhodospirillaceae bacterium]|nr:5-carboxymethyl-2-hydroxymuconate isomerase [Rhodospirillaceae bacterium]|tara:strand:- start:702 stop:1538 length:837 start_codon:yes stop_codon:yes gene_type:complete